MGYWSLSGVSAFSVGMLFGILIALVATVGTALLLDVLAHREARSDWPRWIDEGMREPCYVCGGESKATFRARLRDGTQISLSACQEHALDVRDYVQAQLRGADDGS